MASNHSVQLRVDRLSTLPPELLLSIFDLSHDAGQPLREPLSRTLLPYFRRNFYRQIRLSSSSSLTKLLQTIETTPTFSSMVLHLDNSQLERTTKNSRNLKKLLKFLPSLKSLKSGRVDLFSDPLAVSPSLHLPRLESISHSCKQFPWSYLESFSQFNRLKSVEIHFENLGYDPRGISSHSLITVEELSLKRVWSQQGEEGAEVPEVWTEELARFVNHFSHITHLTVMDQVFPKYSDLLAHLNTSATSLKSLTLSSLPLDELGDISCDHLLPRFVNLERLNLGDRTISALLPSYLRQLLHLRSLRLGLNTHYDGPTPIQLLDLVEGPARIKTLQRFVLDSIPSGQVGRRVDEDEPILAAVDIERDGWYPTYAGFPGWDDASITRLVEAGIENDVDVTGSSLDAAKVWRAYKLENANRIILKAYRTGSFLEYTKAKEDELGDRLPDLDIAQLDPQNLKLVKNDLPQEDWFRFTLE